MMGRRNTLLIGLVALAVQWVGSAAPETSVVVPADDLPAGIRIMSGAASGYEYSWTLIGTNEKAEKQTALHPDLNVVRKVWDCPLARGRHVLKFEFTRAFQTQNYVFHLYVKADADPETGRITEGNLRGVDYMLTLSNGAEEASRDSWTHFAGDGTSQAAPHMTVLKGDVLYLSLDMSVEQKDGRSVFEYLISSYIPERTEQGLRAVANSSFGFVNAVCGAEPAGDQGNDPGKLFNTDLELVDGVVPGWQVLRGRDDLSATIRVDDGDPDGIVMGPVYSPEGLAQTVSLTPGHYLLRALARTDVSQIHLIADRTRMPVSVSNDYRWVELPFCVPLTDKDGRRSTQVGFRYLARPASGNASRLPATLFAKKIELIRLGDTVLRERWIENLPADRFHRMKLINGSPVWERPGKVVFQDAFIGTELWLMTQGGQNDHSYVGHPDFSHDGKYLQIGARRAPRGVLRTDGSRRYLDDKLGNLLWLFPWMEKRLPKGADPSDWIVQSQSMSGAHLRNVVTGQDCHLTFPSRPGWNVVHYPGSTSYGGRGPRIEGITHEALVWASTDQKMLGLSTVDGDRFRTFEVKSISKQPEKDALSPSMSSVGGKSGDNWRDAVDCDGRRYFFFELNRDNLPNHPTNPYQVWAISLMDGDDRGLLRVVSHPNSSVTEYVTSQTGMTKLPSAKWWDFAAGFPWSGDNGELLLEDGTLVYMSSLGMHSSFFGGGTVSINGPDLDGVEFVGNFPKFDRVTWPHEFLRNRDFAVTTSHCEPATPIVVLDLQHRTMWAAALTNFHDYTIRYKTRWNKEAYHKPMFRPASTFSPDFTKVVYFSAMLTGDDPDRKWGDVYVAVVRYPPPPANLRQAGNELVWGLPDRHAEIKGFRLYRSDTSGMGYERVENLLLAGTSCELPSDQKGFYVVTSVEHSGLESRIFSNEVRVGPEAPFRHFYQPELGTLTNPMVPFFNPGSAAGAYAVAITDPELVYKKQLAEGLTGSVTVQVRIPQKSEARILARVRGMSALERSTYMRGWPRTEDVVSGAFTVHINGKEVGNFPVQGPDWRWIALDRGAVKLPAGTVDVKLITSNAGIAVDSILVTDDPEFVPQKRGHCPEELTAVPRGLRTAKFSAEDVGIVKGDSPRIKFVWDPVVAPQGVSHYNVYRADTETLPAEPESLLGSTAETVFRDCGLEADKTLYYCVRAVDAWGNLSPPSEPLAAKPAPPPIRAAFQVFPEQGDGKGTAFRFDASDSQIDAGKITVYQWEFGDGASAHGASVVHAFAKSGTYVIKLKVGSDRGEWATVEQSLYVRPGWLSSALAHGALWVEAEAKSGEGGGVSKAVPGRINASGKAVTFWHKDIGHWLEWTVSVSKTDSYAIVLKYATGSPQVARDCQIDGQFPGDEWRRFVFPETGGFSSTADNWVWQALRGTKDEVLSVELSEGRHVIRMSNLEGGMALDAIMLVPIKAMPSEIRGNARQ